MPCRHASRVLEDLLGVDVSPETACRRCEDVGRRVEEQHTAEAHVPWQDQAHERENPCRMAISADGAMVPVTGGAWAKARTVASGEVPACPVDAETVHVRQRSSVSRLTDAIHCSKLAEGDTRRRHLVQATDVCAVMDGAEWLQACVDIHRRDAVRILDVPHAADHRSTRLEAVSAGGRVFPLGMRERWFHILTHRGPGALARMADR